MLESAEDEVAGISVDAGVCCMGAAEAEFVGGADDVAVDVAGTVVGAAVAVGVVSASDGLSPP